VSVPRIDGIDRDFDRDFPFWQKLAPSLLGRCGSPSARTDGAASSVPQLWAQTVGWGIAPSQVSYYYIYILFETLPGSAEEVFYPHLPGGGWG